MYRIAVGGDTFPPKNRISIDPNIAETFATANKVLLNLEAPIVTDRSKTEMRVSVIKNVLNTKRISCSCNDLEQLPKEWDILWGLANNHIGDFGKTGIADSIECLEERHEDYIGLNRDSIFKIIDTKGQSILIYCINTVQMELGPLQLNVNNRNIFYDGPEGISHWFLKKLAEYSINANLVVGYVHLGRCGFSELREVDLQRLRKINSVLKGKTPHIIVGHHSHQAGEIFQESNMLIFSSLGNFIFNEKDGKFSENFYYNYILEILLEDKIEVRVIPIQITDKEVAIAKEEAIRSFPRFERTYFLDFEKLKL